MYDFASQSWTSGTPLSQGGSFLGCGFALKPDGTPQVVVVHKEFVEVSNDLAGAWR